MTRKGPVSGGTAEAEETLRDALLASGNGWNEYLHG